MFGTNRYRAKQDEVNYRQEEKKILDSVLGAAVYDKRIRPSGINSTGKKNSPPSGLEHVTIFLQQNRQAVQSVYMGHVTFLNSANSNTVFKLVFSEVYLIRI